MRFIVTVPDSLLASVPVRRETEEWMSEVLSDGLKVSVQVEVIQPGSDLALAIEEVVFADVVHRQAGGTT